MEKENAEEKIRQAVLAIRKARANPAGRHWLDVAEGFLVQALALSSPHPEAREEDVKAIRKALELGKDYATQVLQGHDMMYKRHPATERERNEIVDDIILFNKAIKEYNALSSTNTSKE